MLDALVPFRERLSATTRVRVDVAQQPVVTFVEPVMAHDEDAQQMPEAQDVEPPHATVHDEERHVTLPAQD